MECWNCGAPWTPGRETCAWCASRWDDEDTEAQAARHAEEDAYAREEVAA